MTRLPAVFRQPPGLHQSEKDAGAHITRALAPSRDRLVSIHRFLRQREGELPCVPFAFLKYFVSIFLSQLVL